MSLNFAGFGHLMAAETLERRSHRLRALGAAAGCTGASSSSGSPASRTSSARRGGPRYLVYTARTRLPLAALRVMQAEAYIKRPAMRPSQGAWRPAPRPITGASSAPSAISPAATQAAAR